MLTLIKRQELMIVDRLKQHKAKRQNGETERKINTPLMAPSRALASIWIAVSSEAEWRKAKSCSAEYALRAMLWAIDIKKYLMLNGTMGIWIGGRVMLVSLSLDRCQP